MNLAKTPNLDALGKMSSTWVFNNMHSEAACSPSRIAILTARHPMRDCLLGGQVSAQPSYRKETRTVAHLAARLNYRTLFLGKFLPHTGNEDYAKIDRPSHLGFQDWTTLEGGSTFDFACVCRERQLGGDLSRCFLGHETALSFQQRELCLAQSSPDGRDDFPPDGMMETDFLADKFHQWLAHEVEEGEPFFAQISFRSVHVPFVASPDLRNACERNEICNPTPLPKTSVQLDYAGCVHSIDQAVGRIRDSIRALRPNDYDNTIFLFLSDNGPARTSGVEEPGAGNAGGLRGNKQSLFEGLLRVPALLNWPRAIKTSAVVHSLVSIMDIPATLAHAMSNRANSMTTEEAVDGISLLPFILSATVDFVRPKHLAICAHTTDPEVAKGLACASFAFFDPTGRWKMIAERVSKTRLGTAPASQVKKSTVQLYDMRAVDLEAQTVDMNVGPRTDMIREANAWLQDVFASFRANCPSYYSL